MTTLTVTATEDYRDGSPSIPANTDKIVFATSGATTARFNSSQFGGSGISNTVEITGDGNVNFIAVHTLLDDSFSAAAWTFLTWSANDRVLLFGTNDDETITGSTQSNSIEGGGGLDFLTGGNQDDIFTYTSSSHAVSGEIVNGVGGTDQISVTGQDVDLSLVGIVSIERIFVAGSATLDADQIGAGAINEFVGPGTFLGTVNVNGSSTDLSGVTFTSWDVTNHFVVVNGTGGADDLTGSSQNDTITGGLGADTIVGGNGNDTFVYNTFAENATGETVDGGGGTADALRVNVGENFSLIFNAATLTGVEKVVFAAGANLILAAATLATPQVSSMRLPAAPGRTASG